MDVGTDASAQCKLLNLRAYCCSGSKWTRKAASVRINTQVDFRLDLTEICENIYTHFLLSWSKLPSSAV